MTPADRGVVVSWALADFASGHVDEFDSAVFGFAVVGGVACDRGGEGDADGEEALAFNALGGEVFDDAFGAFLGEGAVVVEGAGSVGVADDEDA